MLTNRLICTFLLSVLLHLAGVLLVNEYWQDAPQTAVFQARLAQRPRFIEPPQVPLEMDLPSVEMEYLPSQAQPEYPAPQDVPTDWPPHPTDDALEGLALETDEALAIKPGAPALARETMPSVGGPVFIDTVESEAFDLLRMQDMARADGRRAVVIPDPRNRRDVRGYINFTHLYLDGASTHPGRILDQLARYMRDYTGILAQVRDTSQQYFLSPQLLKDPIHFMFPDRRRGGGDSDQLLYFSDEELALLGRYLREGGFLFVEGGRAWLGEAIAYVYRALDGDGRLIEVPFSHPLYHSFYDFDSGFPGDEQKQLISVPLPRWYFSSGYKDRRGIWGVERNGELVALFSDMNLSGQWIQESENGDSATTLFLQAATNMVVYGLLRPDGITPKRPPPAWETAFPHQPIASNGVASDALAVLDEDLWDVLDASVVLVHTPRGDPMAHDGLSVRVDGGYTVEMIRGGRHALVLHNLPAGRHLVELAYQGQQQDLEVELKGGRTLVLDFGIDRLMFWQRLRLTAQKEWLEAEERQRHLNGLQVEEIWLGSAKLDLD